MTPSLPDKSAMARAVDPMPGIDVASAVDDVLHETLLRRRETSPHPWFTELVDLVAQSVMLGGKRMRPQLVYWGWRGAGGGHVPVILHAAASMELVHAFALIHDDIIDAGTTRRGIPCLHHRAARRHRADHWRGDPDAFGISAALLAGDLALIWADELLLSIEHDPQQLHAAYRVFARLRVEAVAGQYLDLVNPLTTTQPLDPRTVNHLKTTMYSVVRPLQLGAALHGSGDRLASGYARFGEPLGAAFQLRDDILDLFGDPDLTGKAVGDDVRSGRHTMLMESALALATGSDARHLAAVVGNQQADADTIAQVRDIVERVGARDQVEAAITGLVTDAYRALDALGLDRDTHTALMWITESAAFRDH